MFNVTPVDTPFYSKRVEFLTTIPKNFNPNKLQHPFADKQTTPFDEWLHIITTGIETCIQIILIDIVLNGFFYYTFKILEFILLSPIAIIGVVIEYSRILFIKSKRKLMRRHHKENSPNSRRDLSSP